MRIGFIGAGKVGSSLGKYFSMKGLELSGYFSQTQTSSLEAAQFTDSKQYFSKQELIADSDLLFITVTDGAIQSVWESIKTENLTGKFICHCSGSLSSGIFSDISSCGAYGYSVHPLYAIPSKTQSYKDLAQTMFTLEGEPSHLELMKEWLSQLGNKVVTIPTESKAVYHAAAVFASNHVVAVSMVANSLLEQCGFSADEALSAITPLMQGNLGHIVEQGPLQALTGPVERNDYTTIKRHLDCLPEEYTGLYKELSKVLVEMGSKRHPKEDYTKIRNLIST